MKKKVLLKQENTIYSLTNSMKSTEVQNPRCRLGGKCICLSVHCAFLFFGAKAWPRHKLTFSLAVWYYTVGIPFTTRWAYYSFWTSCKRQSQTPKLNGKTTILRAPNHVVIHYHYVYVMEKYTETLHVKKMTALVYNASNFWTKQV